jgi:sterol desaturase/sphingolipid hydroxylase (fatty acid hydroxylase superfamily)
MNVVTFLHILFPAGVVHCRYWIHTDLIDRLPLGLEYVFNSPMAHRMHHRPPGNCNYAGMFIFWDRMFGTYEVELERKDYYGLAKQPQVCLGFPGCGEHNVDETWSSQLKHHLYTHGRKSRSHI